MINSTANQLGLLYETKVDFLTIFGLPILKKVTFVIKRFDYRLNNGYVAQIQA